MKSVNSISLNKIYILLSLAMISWAIAWTNAKIVGEYLSFYNLVFLITTENMGYNIHEN